MRLKRTHYQAGFGDFVRRKRLERQESQAQLARRLDLSQSLISHMESDNHVPERELLIAALLRGNEELEEWLRAAGYPTDMELIDSSIVRRVEPSAEEGVTPNLPVRGEIGDYGEVSLRPDPAAWGQQAVEYEVQTDTLAPWFIRGDRLHFEPANAAARGEVVIVEHRGEERLVRYVGAREGALLVVPPVAQTYSHPTELPGALVRGVLVEQIRSHRTRRRRP